MSGSITTINNKRCTAVPKVNNVGGGQSTRTTTSAATSSIFISTSTILTSSSEELVATSTSISLGNLPVNAPAQNPSTSTQVTLTSTTSSISSQSVIPSTTSIPSATETSAPLIPTSILSPVTESLVTSSTALSFSPIDTSSLQITNEDSSPTSRTNDSVAPTTRSDVLPSTSTSGIAAGDAAVTGTTTQAGAGQIESASGAPGLTNGAQNVPGSGMSTQATVAVAGGVIGGLVVISIIAFLLWFYRKRLVKKRRSTMLTPLSTDNAYTRGEKGSYVISRNSLGPTTIPEKVRAVVGYNYQRLRGRVNSLVTRSPKPSVDLNRGNSQFGLPDTPTSRSSSRAGMTNEGAATTNNRFVDWWGRLIEDGNLNWKLRNDPKNGRPDNSSYTSMPNAAQTRQKVGQPDFLTLLSMDEKQQQQAVGGGAGGSNPRRSQSLGNEHFLGGLGLKFDTENPFADSNAMSHDSAKVMPLTVSGLKNPFSDANAILEPARVAMAGNASNSSPNRGAGGPATYVQNIRRSRGYSVSAANPNIRSPSVGTGAAGARIPSVYRESSVSVETSDTRRNKFRSDPFDLDRPELLAQSSSDSGAAGSRYSPPSRGQAQAQGVPSIPRPTRARAESFTSKYSSGVSMADWSDPGPDVGPAAAGRWETTPSPDGALGRRRMDAPGPGPGPGSGGGRRGSGSAGNGIGVGKAL